MRQALTARQKQVILELSEASSIDFYGDAHKPDIRYRLGADTKYVPIVIGRNLIAKGYLKLTPVGTYSTKCEVVS